MDIEHEINPPDVHEDHEGDEGSVAIILELVDEQDRNLRVMMHLNEPSEADIAEGIAKLINGIASMRGMELQVALAQRLGLLP